MSRIRIVPLLAVIVSSHFVVACSQSATRAFECAAGRSCIAKTDLIPAEFGDGGTGRAADEPVWLATTTVLDPLPAGVTLDTRYTTPRRIRWEVTENFIIAREVTDPTDPLRSPPPYAAYRIDSHFDPRDRVPAGCAESCGEGSPSAPWNERPMIRLDWSLDLIDMHFIGGVSSGSVPLFVNMPADPNAPQFECGGSACAGYPYAIGPITRISVTHREAIAVVADADAGGTGDASADATVTVAEVFFRTEYARER